MSKVLKTWVTLLCIEGHTLRITLDPNTKSLNYNKIQLKALNYFKLETLGIR